MNEIEKLINEASSKPFSPFIGYDEALDTISFEMDDCSFEEKDVAPGVTFLLRNHPGPSDNPIAGIRISGAKAVLRAAGISKDEANRPNRTRSAKAIRSAKIRAALKRANRAFGNALRKLSEY